TRAPLAVAGGSRRIGAWRRSNAERSPGRSPRKYWRGRPPHARPTFPSASRPTAAEARRTNPRLVTFDDRAAVASVIADQDPGSVPARVEPRPAIGPIDVRLEGLHGVGVGVDPHPLLRLLDAPVDHVSKRPELLDLLLELRELIGMRVRRERVAHGARHARRRERDAHLLLGRCVPLDEKIAGPNLRQQRLG